MNQSVNKKKINKKSKVKYRQAVPVSEKYPQASRPNYKKPVYIEHLTIKGLHKYNGC